MKTAQKKTYRDFQETSSKLIGQGLSLLLRYYSLLHVALVTDHNHGDLGFKPNVANHIINYGLYTRSNFGTHLSIGMNAENLFANFTEFLESLVIDNAVNEQKTITSVHECLAKRGVRILASRVKNFHLHRLALNIDRCLVRLLNSRVVLA